MVQKDLSIKVIDFSKAMTFEPGETTTGSYGSEFYRTPQMEEGLAYDPFKADVWSSVVILFFMLTGKYPNDGISPLYSHCSRRICKAELGGKFPKHALRIAKELGPGRGH